MERENAELLFHVHAALSRKSRPRYPLTSAGSSLPRPARGRAPLEEVQRSSNVVARVARKGRLASFERFGQHNSFILQHTSKSRKWHPRHREDVKETTLTLRVRVCPKSQEFERSWRGLVFRQDRNDTCVSYFCSRHLARHAGSIMHIHRELEAMRKISRSGAREVSRVQVLNRHLLRIFLSSKVLIFLDRAVTCRRKDHLKIPCSSAQELLN